MLKPHFFALRSSLVIKKLLSLLFPLQLLCIFRNRAKNYENFTQKLIWLHVNTILGISFAFFSCVYSEMEKFSFCNLASFIFLIRSTDFFGNFSKFDVENLPVSCLYVVQIIKRWKCQNLFTFMSCVITWRYLMWSVHLMLLFDVSHFHAFSFFSK